MEVALKYVMRPRLLPLCQRKNAKLKFFWIFADIDIEFVVLHLLFYTIFCYAL